MQEAITDGFLSIREDFEAARDRNAPAVVIQPSRLVCGSMALQCRDARNCRISFALGASPVKALPRGLTARFSGPKSRMSRMLDELYSNHEGQLR